MTAARRAAVEDTDMGRLFGVLFSGVIALGAIGSAMGGEGQPHEAEREYRAVLQEIEAQVKAKVDEIERNLRAQHTELQAYMDRGMKALEGKSEQEMKQGLQALEAEISMRRQALERDAVAAMKRLDQEMQGRLEQEIRRIREKYGKDAVEIAVALDGLAVFVHESNPIEELTLAQLKAIYRGKTKSWAELGWKQKK